jgi:hypothetical protein
MNNVKIALQALASLETALGTRQGLSRENPALQLSLQAFVKSITTDTELVGQTDAFLVEARRLTTEIYDLSATPSLNATGVKLSRAFETAVQLKILYDITARADVRRVLEELNDLLGICVTRFSERLNLFLNQ